MAEAPMEAPMGAPMDAPLNTPMQSHMDGHIGSMQGHMQVNPMGHIPMQSMEHAPMEHTPLASQVPMEQAPMEQTQMQQTMEQTQIEQAPLEQQPSTTPGPSASSESDTNNEKNPWAVASIYDFNYFCCPDCDHRTQDKQQFVVHAAFFHARVSSKGYLDTVSRQ